MIDSDMEFQSIIEELIENDKVQEMKKFRQHCDTSCYEHCYMASRYSYNICKKLGWDYKSATRAAMLHDLFLYDWREKSDRKGLHAFTHPKVARDNASKLFLLSEKEKSIIETHMWPLTLQLPKSREAFLLTFVDKYCAISESSKYVKKNLENNTYFKYAYLLLGFIILSLNKWGKVVILSIIRSSMF